MGYGDGDDDDDDENGHNKCSRERNRGAHPANPLNNIDLGSHYFPRRNILRRSLLTLSATRRASALHSGPSPISGTSGDSTDETSMRPGVVSNGELQWDNELDSWFRLTFTTTA